MEEAVEFLKLWNVLGRRLERLLEKYVSDSDGLAEIKQCLSLCFQNSNKLIRAQAEAEYKQQSGEKNHEDKNGNAREYISPNLCKHPDKIFVEQGRGAGWEFSEEHYVTVCPDCGTFEVYKRLNGESTKHTFYLTCTNAINAAGRFRQYIEHHKEGK
jgi:hypothetical protein